jgi:hypothetical protein
MAGKKAKWVKLSQARREFTPAFKSSWPYTLLGLIVGIALVFLAKFLSPSGSEGQAQGEETVVHLVVEHLGMGFLVSAIAVFFYEWGAHIRKALELAEQLSSTIKHDLAPIAMAAGEAALLRGLESLLKDNSAVGGKHVTEVISDVEKLVKALCGIQQGRIWIKEEYIAYIADLLRAVRENAECLQKLGDGDEHRLIVPVGGEDLVDAILSAQIRSLDADDSYDVLSNLASWRGGGLRDLRKATKEAVDRKVSVRRVFNTLFYVEMRQDEVRKILLEQLKDMNDWGQEFQVKVLRREDLDKGASALMVEDVKISHFGIFRHGDNRLRIKLDRTDQIMMSVKADFETEFFEEAFRTAQTLTAELIEACMAEYPKQ